GLVARERRLVDAEAAAILIVNGAAQGEADDATARGRAAPGPVAGEGSVIDVGGALVLDGAADTQAARAAPAIATEGLIAGEGRVVHGQRAPPLIEDSASQGVDTGAVGRLIVGNDAAGHRQVAARVVDAGALDRVALRDGQFGDGHAHTAANVKDPAA